VGWVDPWVAFGRVGSRFSVFGGLGWVGSVIRLSVSKVEATELERWSLHAGLLSCCWGHFKHLSEELVPGPTKL